MMNHLKTIYVALAVSVIVLGALIGCKESPTNVEHSHAGMSEEGAELYQCSMHPNIVANKPGQCPICAMDLQAVKKSSAEGIAGRSPVELTGQQRQLINIRTAAVRKGTAVKSIRTVGVLEHDASRVFTVAAWTSGRIEKLFVDKPEIDVTSGDLLYSIYSPELYSTMQEYVSLRSQNTKNELLIASTRTRLKLLGLDTAQIEHLSSVEVVPTSIEVPAPASGKVMMKMVKEGAYVRTGDPLYSIVDLSKLWLIVTVYEPELADIRPGMTVVATTATYPGEKFLGKVELINHHVDQKSRSAQLRVVFNQPEQLMSMSTDSGGAMHHQHRLLPDMYMDAEIQIDLGNQMLVPDVSVFNTGKRAYVFVEEGEGLFIPKEVVLGQKVEHFYVVEQGVEEGAAVVIDGNFLLDSESQLKAAAEGSYLDSGSGSESESERLPEALKKPIHAMVDAYVGIGKELAADAQGHLTEKKSELLDAVVSLSESGIIPLELADGYRARIETINKALTEFDVTQLESARVGYGHLSKAIVEFFGSYRVELDTTLRVANCPMWKQSSGDWIQFGEELENPYMGQKMLRCGSITKVIGVEGL